MSRKMAAWQVGLASVDVTPPPGLPMMGNFRVDYAAIGTHDPLTARAIVIQDPNGKSPVALVSLDLCMIPRTYVRLMRHWISEQTNIPPAHVLIAATHTHSGPATMGLYGMPKANAGAIEGCLRVAVSAVSTAIANTRTVKLTIARGTEERLAFNRRLLSVAGTTHMNWEDVPPTDIANVLGPTDPEVLAIHIADEDGPSGAVVNFALHPAVLDYENRLYSADYPGYLAEALRDLRGNRFESLFFNGCCGNVNHIDYTDGSAPRRGYQATQRIGFMLAVAVHSALENNSALLVPGPVTVLSECVRLKRHPISEDAVTWATDVLNRDDTPFADSADGFPPEARAETWLEMHALQHEDDTVEIMAIRIGDLAIIGLPGEIFCEFGLRLKANSPAAYTMVVELANDAVGYLPTEEAFAQGGYEVVPGSTRYAPGAGEKLVEAAQELLGRLFAN